MDTDLPDGFRTPRQNMQHGQTPPAESLSVKTGGIFYPVLRQWPGGFIVRDGDVPPLEGVVHLFDGAEQLFACLITGSDTECGERTFTIKRASRYDYVGAIETENGA